MTLVGLDSLREEAGIVDDPAHLVFLNGVDDEGVMLGAEQVAARVARFARACRAMAERGETMLAWIGKDPAR